jgi:tetratricopeptide (TPR) repeat protein
MPRMIASSLLALLALTFTLPARAAGVQWFEVTSPHFVVLTDASEKQGRQVATQLERMRAVFHLLVPTASDSAGSPIIVLALKNKAGFDALEEQSYLVKGQLQRVGVFLRAPDKNYILLRLDGGGEHPYATIYHEYTHYMLRNASQWIPLWLNEGLAQFYQNSDIHEKDVLVGEPDANNILYLRQRQLLPLKTLLAVDASSPYYHEEQKGSVFYAESWALTHYLEITDQETHQHRVQDYAELLVKKVDPQVAAQQAFGDLAKLQNSLNWYVNQGQYQMFRVKTEITIDESGFQSRAIPRADADATRADVMVHMQRTKDAETLLGSVLQEDPTNALANESMGYLKFREGNIDAARKWYGEAVKLDSKSYLAQYYYAVMSLQSPDDVQEEAIEKSLRASIQLNPNFAPAYDALASLVCRNPARGSEAHMLNLRAIGLEPDNLNYRLNAASVLLNARQFSGALAVLRAAGRVAKTPEQAATVQSQIAMMERAEQANGQRDSAGAVEVTATGTALRRAAGTTTIMSSNGTTYTLQETAEETKHEAEAAPAEAGPGEAAQAGTRAEAGPTGPHHTASGTIRHVTCAYPSKLTLTLEDKAGAHLTFSTKNFFHLEISAVNFTPSGDMNPCTDLENTKAKVDYAEEVDHTSDGVIVSIALSK